MEKLIDNLTDTPKEKGPAHLHCVVHLPNCVRRQVKTNGKSKRRKNLGKWDVSNISYEIRANMKKRPTFACWLV